MKMNVMMSKINDIPLRMTAISNVEREKFLRIRVIVPSTKKVSISKNR